MYVLICCSQLRVLGAVKNERNVRFASDSRTWHGRSTYVVPKIVSAWRLSLRGANVFASRRRRRPGKPVEDATPRRGMTLHAVSSTENGKLNVYYSRLQKEISTECNRL